MHFNPLKLPKPQRLHLTSERDCGVAVFAALTGISENEIRHDLPEAHFGEVSVDGWTRWLQRKGLEIRRQAACSDDFVPCAHLVALDERRDGAHWIHRDDDGDIHDPSPTFRYFAADDARMRSISFYPEKVLTLSVSFRP
jgi:hypothetical protein